MLASSPDRGRRPQVRGGSFPDPASAPEGPSGIRSSGLKPSQISHRRVFALRRTSVLFCSKNSNSANPDAQERLSQAPAFPFGCFQYSAPAARWPGKCGAVRLRPSTVPVLCPEKSGLVSGDWPAASRNSKKESIYRSKAAERLNRTADAPVARNAGVQEPASHHAAP